MSSKQPTSRLSARYITLLILSVLAAAIVALNAPTTTQAAGTVLPTGIDTFKIEVNQDGIFELTYAELQAAGMDVDNVNPNTFEMMHKGKSVAYEFVGNGDNTFDANESVRFYGHSDMLRKTYLYTDYNYYWIWAQGTPTRIDSVANQTSCEVVDSFRDVAKYEDDEYFIRPSSPYTGDGINGDGDKYESPPDFWHSKPLDVDGRNQRDIALTVDHPVPNGDPAEIRMDTMSYQLDITFEAALSLKSDPSTRTTRSWFDSRQVYVSAEVPSASLVNGDNDVSVEAVQARFMINTIEIFYDRETTVANNEIQIHMPIEGCYQYNVSGMTETNPANIIAWNVTDSEMPVATTVSAANGGNYELGITTGDNGEIIVTTPDNMKDEASISKYVGKNLDPAGGGSQWVGITHNDFLAEANEFATYRAGASQTTTFVADVEDVFNQYGYGYPEPESIQAYMRHAYADWSITPKYLLLFGDATTDPSQRIFRNDWGIEQVESGAWDPAAVAQSFIPSDMIMQDQYQGLSISDHIYSQLDGDDLIPEVAVGRIAANTPEDVITVLDKTKRYEEAVFNGEEYVDNIGFMSTKRDFKATSYPDTFCTESLETSEIIPDDKNITHWCSDDYTGTSDQYVDEIYDNVNTEGVGIFNYRGHGAVSYWWELDDPDNVNSGSTSLTGTKDVDRLTNANQPMVIISADCLDGNFAETRYEDPTGLKNNPGIGETFLLADNGGSAAHWSATGLGLSSWHTIMHDNFYLGLYATGGNATIGDAILFAKTQYMLEQPRSGGVRPPRGSELYEMNSFVLQGDPALIMAGTAFPTAISVQSIDSATATNPAILLGFGIVATTTVVVTRKRKEA